MKKGTIKSWLLAVMILVLTFCVLPGIDVCAADQTVMLKGTQDYSKAAEVLTLVNQERAKAGLNSLGTNSTIQANAMQRASELAVYYSHTRPDDTDCLTALTVSYRSAGENIAYGQSTAEAVMTAWMNSDGHKANILNTKYTQIGIGCFVQNGHIFWVQMFTDNSASGTVSSGQKEVIAAVDANAANLYLYAGREDTGFCYGSSINVKEGETADVAIYNVNRGITGYNVPIEMMACSFNYKSTNPYSGYFLYDFDSTGQYLSVTGVKSNQSLGTAMPVLFGVGAYMCSTNVVVKHEHTPGPEATCTTDQICTSCKEVLVKASGHKQSHYIACVKDITCTKCGIVLQKATGHTIQEATCTEPAKCTTCGEKFGNKLYHTYPPRNCLEPLYCSRCGYQRYKAYESHYWASSTELYQSATISSPALYKQECLICDQYRLIKKGEKAKATLKLNLSAITLKKKQTFSGLKATKMSKGDSLASVKSNKKSVVEVLGFTADGKNSLKAKKTGTATLTIKTEANAKKTVKVTVQSKAVKTTAITNVKKNLTMKVGKTKELKLILKPLYSSEKITFKSSNKRVVSVNSKGILTAKKKGTASITVKSGSKTVKCKVKVK